MKNRPVKHKAENAFKFKKFSERIQEIDIRRGVLYHIDHHVGEDEPTEDESYFYLALQKWQVLNLTDEYDKFAKGVRGIVTLPQVLLKKEFIFEHLFECLQSATKLSLQALLEFVVILAKELQEYFCEWLPKILYKLTTLLQDKDAEIVEWTLLCLAYLFKHLKKHLKKDFSLVLNLVMPIMDERRSKEHIQNFAIECFSYVARDIRDRQQLFDLIVRFCGDNPNVVKSCGHLLFQIIQGVPGQFHSSAEQFLISLFDVIEKKGANLELWEELMENFLTSMLLEITPKGVELYWQVFMTRVQSAVELQKEVQKEVQEAERKKKGAKYFPLYLHSLLQLLKFKRGAFISNQKQLIDLILTLTKMNLSEELERCVCELISAVLSAKSVNLPHLEANQLIRAALKVKHYSNFEFFILHSMNYSQFEQLIFPALLSSLEEGTYPLNLASLELICRVLQHKSPLFHDGSDYDNFRPAIQLAAWSKYPKIHGYLDELLGAPSAHFLSRPECCLALVACRYDKSCGNDARINSQLLGVGAAEDGELWSRVVAKSNDGENLNGTALFGYCLIMEQLVAANYDQLQPETIIHNLLPLCKSSSSSEQPSFEALRLVDLLLTYSARHRPQLLTYDLFLRLHATHSDLLSSPRHDIRLLVTHSLALFSNLEELRVENELFIYELMSRVEATEASIETYRGQLQMLQKLTYDSRYYRACTTKNKVVRGDGLKYLLGVLYLNFKLIWQPTMDAISSYGQAMDVDEFWQVYKRQLTVGLSEVGPVEEEEGQQQHAKEKEEPFAFVNSSPTLKSLHEIRTEARYKADFVNYRKHIWSLLPNFRVLLERKNRELVTMFFDFYEHQYRMHMEKMSNVRKNIRIAREEDSSAAPSPSSASASDADPDAAEITEGDDLSGVKATPMDVSEDKQEEEDDEDEEEDEEGTTGKDDSVAAGSEDEDEEDDEPQWDGKMYHGQLMNYLSMFQNLPNPRTVFKSKQLYDVYLDLLAHKNATIQKLALDCLLSYRDKVLDAYRDPLSRLIDEKTFRDQLASFCIAETGKSDVLVLPKEHREPVMRLLKNILYGKMYTRLVAAKKSAVQQRKTTVIRYLNGFTDDELMGFIKLCFGPFAAQLDATLSLDACIDQATAVSLDNALHAKYLQSAVSLIDSMLEQFGTKGDVILRTLFKLLLLVLATVQAILLQAELGQRVAGISMYKGVRREAAGLLRRFFDQFDRYNFSTSELEAVFRFVVWPAIDNMPQDCTAVPTALFKLFHTWTKSPRYFPLLTKYRTPDRDVTPLAQVMKLLLPNKSSARIANQILDMVHNLLTLTHVEDKENVPLTCQLEGLLPVSPEVQSRFEGVVNFGSIILVPHLDAVIERLRHKLGQQQRKRRQQHVAKEVTGKRDLLILNRITELVVDKSKCDVLVALLLPILTSRTAGQVTNEGAMVQMIGSLICLFKKTTCPERHIRTVAPLFDSATQASPRKLLTDLFGTFEDKPLAALIVEMNAMNRRWVDQPDYDRRLGAFKVIDDWLKADSMDVNRALVVLYHIFYYLRCDKDLAMRSTSSYCLKKVVLHLAAKYEKVTGGAAAADRQYLFEGVILKAIKRGIVGPTETLRNECISLLGDLARHHPHVHYVFADLQPLTNAQDKEVDYFENLVHIQTHRNARAMVKFVTLAKQEGTQMNHRTLMDYVYPMVGVYMCNEKYVHNNALVDTAIECVAAVCKLLPFQQYQTVLRVFIKKLRTNIEYQKQMVKLVVGIIEEFHFDFSECEKEVEEQKKQAIAQKTGQPVIVANKKNQKALEEEKEKAKKLKEKIAQEEDDEDEDEDDDKDLREVKRETKALLKSTTTTTPSPTGPKKHTSSEYALMMGLVQSLNNSVFELSARDSAHKANKHEQRKFEEEEILKVPIALATVQLLQKVSKKLLDQNLAKILMKMCSYLKSRLKSVRIITRDILRKMMLILGPAYLHILLDLLTTLLSRGFQVHVLVVTLHNILDAMRPTLSKDGCMDKNMSKVLAVCMGDVFGQAAEEKEVAKIGSKTPEAKTSNKSYGIMNIMAGTVSEKCLLDVVVPFKEQLSKTNSAKVVNKVQICFNKIINGLMENRQISSKSYLAFVYGILTENIANLKFTLKGGAAENSSGDKPAVTAAKKSIIPERPDIYLIADEHSATKRREQLIKKSALTNAHVLNEFALNLLNSVLKNEKLDAVEFAAYVNPIVPHLLELIKGAHVRVITLAVKCISAIWNRQIALEHLDAGLAALVDRLFEILRKYSGQDLSTNDENYQLIKASFKAIRSLIRFVDKYPIGTDQLKSLLFYVDQDLHNKQGIAFPLLRAIIAKRMFVPELHDTMQSVSKMAITSEQESVRDEARQILMVFFLEYPLGERFAGHMKFFMSQLAYEVVGGRESAVKMLQVIMKRVPKNIMAKNLSITFLTLGTRMVNDDQPSIRALVSKCIEELINRSEKKRREELFDMVLALFDDPQPSHVEMAAMYCARFLAADKDFESRLGQLLPIVVRKLTVDKSLPGRFVREMGLAENETQQPVDVEESETGLWLQKARDHQLIQLLNFTAKLLETHAAVLLRQSRFVADVDELAYVCQRLLAYEHAWVRLNAAKVIGQILQSIDFELLRNRLSASLNANGSDDEVEEEDDANAAADEGCKRLYLYANPQSEIRSLVLDLCAQLRADSPDEEMAEEVMKNLLVIAVILRDVPLNVVTTTTPEDEEQDDKQQQPQQRTPKSLNLIWLIRRVNYIANSEVIHTPHATLLRKAIFNWIEGLVNVLEKETVAVLAPLLLASVMREVSPDNNNTHTELKRLANKILAKMRKAAGDTELNQVLNKLQQRQMIKRAERKTQEARDRLQNPEKAVKRRVSQLQSKKMAKKRKMDVIKGKLAPTRKRKLRETNEDFL